ncbi:MAG: amino acid ABC transporter permease, partial [Pseudomonadota bacterium]
MSTQTAHTSFVRKEMLPEQAPPAREAGAIKWLRENLFSSIPNAIMTIVSLYVIYVVLAGVLPWMVNGIWDAGSLNECREIRDARYGPSSGEHGHGVACWAVLVDRWDQLMFGFYPSELYWRPILAFLLFFGAILPILYDNLSRKLLYVSAAAPFICFWLLWGGSIWSPILVAAGFGIGWAVLKVGTPILGNLAATIAAAVVPILYWLIAVGPLIGGLSAIIPIGIESVDSRDFGGFLLAFVIGASGIILSMPLGVVLALGRQSDLFIINKFSVIFIEVIRGVPLIVWLFTAQLLLGYFLPPG